MKLSNLLFIVLLVKTQCIYYGYDCLEPQYDCPIIGIELGNTFSSASVFNRGDFQLIRDQYANTHIPSVIAFANSEFEVGWSAKNKLSENSQNTVPNILSLIGKSYYDIVIQYQKTLPGYRIININQKPYIQFIQGNRRIFFSTEEILSQLLRKLKRMSQAHLRKSVKDVIITVPSSFDNHQRQSVRKAAKLIGLEVVRILNEPASAAIAYESDILQGQTKILVFHLGGKRVEATVLLFDDGVYETLSSEESNTNPGDHFNNNIFGYVMNKASENIQQILRNKTFLDYFQKQIQDAKIRLSKINYTVIQISQAKQDEINSNIILTRQKFEQINQKSFNYAIDHIDRVLKRLNLTYSDIDKVILTGSSTKIPRIKRMIKDIFENQKIITGVDPSYVSAYGAASQGRKLCKNLIERHEQVPIFILPFSIFIEVQQSNLFKIIYADVLPLKNKQTIMIRGSKLPYVSFKILIKRYEDSLQSYLLGQFTLQNVQFIGKQWIEIDVLFEVSPDYQLSVSILDKDNKNNAIYIKKICLNQIRIKSLKIIGLQKSFLLKNKSKQKRILI